MPESEILRKMAEQAYKECESVPDKSGPEGGMKYDAGKIDWSIIDLELVEEIVKVLMFGEKKYARDSWQTVPNGERRYYAALMRHLRDYRKGEANDPESNLLHLAHAACNLYFLTWFQKQCLLKAEEKP